MTNIEITIRKLIAQVLDLDVTAVIPSAPLKELGADALDYVEMIIQLGRFFTGELCEQEAQQVSTVGGLIACYGKLQPAYAIA